MVARRITRMLFAGLVAAGTVLATTGPALADTLVEHFKFTGTSVTVIADRCAPFNTPSTPGGQRCESLAFQATRGAVFANGRTASVTGIVIASFLVLDSAGNFVSERDAFGVTAFDGGSVTLKSAAMNSATVTGSVNVQFFANGDFSHPVGTGVYPVSLKVTGTGPISRNSEIQSVTGKSTLTLHAVTTFRDRSAVAEGRVGPFAGPFEANIDIGHSIESTITRS